MPPGDAVAVLSERAERPMSDGRNRRAAQTRRKIIDAAKAMIAETSDAPTVVGVARRAEVSVRSVFQHFGDVESLFVTVADSVREDVEVPQHFPAGRALAVRVEAVVDGLAQLFDKIVPIRVAAGNFPGHPALIQRSMAGRRELRAATMAAFAPEFAALTEQAREELADAIGAALSLDAWIVLRRREGMSLERASSIWRMTLTALLEHELATSAKPVG